MHQYYLDFKVQSVGDSVPECVARLKFDLGPLQGGFASLILVIFLGGILQESSMDNLNL